MEGILETPRCLLRELRPSDAEAFYRLNLDKEVLKYTADQAFTSVQAAEDFLQSYDQYRRYGLGRMAVLEKKSGAFLGWCGLRYQEAKGEYDIGFRFFREFWGQGYATETASAVLKYGFEKHGIPKILARAMPANLASVAVLKKLGMRPSGLVHEHGQEWLLFELDVGMPF